MIQINIQKIWHKRTVMVICGVCSIIPSFYTHAQAVGLQPVIESALVQDYNIYRTEEKVQDTILNVSPLIAYTGLLGKQTLKAQYKGNYALYKNNDNLNYYDHDVSLKATLDHSLRFSSEFSAGYQNKIEQPGATNAFSSQLNEFNQRVSSLMSAKLLYGTKQSTGQLVAQYDYSQLEYKNNDQSFRDYDKDALTATFFYRVAPKTRLLLETSAAELTYQNTQVNDLSSRQTNYLAGIEWNATAITSSILKIGYLDINYTSDLFSDRSGLSYFLDMFWKPNTYSLITIGANRSAQESAQQGLGGYIGNTYKIGISHEFTAMTKVSLAYNLSELDYNYNQSRKDKLSNISAKIGFQSKTWLQLFAEFELSKRQSDFAQNSYNANIISVGAIVSFN